MRFITVAAVVFITTQAPAQAQDADTEVNRLVAMFVGCASSSISMKDDPATSIEFMSQLIYKSCLGSTIDSMLLANTPGEIGNRVVLTVRESRDRYIINIGIELMDARAKSAK